MSIKDVLRNIGNLFINLKYSRIMKQVSKIMRKLTGVWNTVGLCGLKQTHFNDEENLYIGAVVFHIPHHQNIN
jgi:hypothetical protein